MKPGASAQRAAPRMGDVRMRPGQGARPRDVLNPFDPALPLVSALKPEGPLIRES